MSTKNRDKAQASEYRLYIKNMVCNRCIMVVRELLSMLDADPLSVELGVVVLRKKPSAESMRIIQERVEALGFELLDDRRSILVGQVKSAVIRLVHNENNRIRENLSDYISSAVHHDYSYVSNIFSEVENTTIEKYFIAQKIERVKELLAYDELSLNEIADLLNYSSAAHLSSQFKKITGLTPSHFKKIKDNRRKELDKV